MGESKGSDVAVGDRDELRDRARGLVDELAAQQRVLAAAQARQAQLMLEFSAVRAGLDTRRISDQRSAGLPPRYTPGEFAATEIALAVTASTFSVQRLLGIADRLRAETPHVWDAWLAGEIDHGKAQRINRAVRQLTRASSKQLLNVLVVPVAVCKPAELLSRWLNQFVAKVEPDQADERLRRSHADRYVSVRPDIDGISFLSAALSAVDADAIDQVLRALAGMAEPGDTRTLQQRRADALVDVLLGRVSNGCHVNWEATDDDTTADDDDADGADGADDGDRDCDGLDADPGSDGDGDSDTADADTADADADESPAWDEDADFRLPASAFRPDPRTTTPATRPPAPEQRPPGGPHSPGRGRRPEDGRQPPDPDRPGRAVITPCPCHHPTPGIAARGIPAVIGVVVTVQSLLGATNTPGQLTDRSALVPADLIRHLADQPGTLFHQLLTDHHGNLLKVTELGRFPTTKLGRAVGYRTPQLRPPRLHHPCHPQRPGPHHPRPDRTHYRRQPATRLPPRPPRQNPCRPPDCPPRRTHQHMDHPHRPHLHQPRHPTPGRHLARRVGRRQHRYQTARSGKLL